MDGKTHVYLDLAAIPAVGAAMLDKRPAFVFGGSGGSILWANAAGITLLGADSVGGLVSRELGPVEGRIGRLADLLPSGRSRLEILRLTHATLVAECRRLDLADGSRAVLAIGRGGESNGPLATRAECLARAVAGGDGMAAIIDDDGKVLGASIGYVDVMAADGPTWRTMGDLEVGEVPFFCEGRRLRLVLAQPASRRESAVAATEPPPAADRDATARPPAVAPAAVSGPARFVWRTDREHRFTLVSPELAEAVGADSGAITGRTWAAVAGALDLDPEGAVGAALDTAAVWTATVAWPVAGEDARIAVDLTAMPVITRSGEPDGFRGFGFCHLDDRHRDDAGAMPGAGEAAREAEDMEPTPDAADTISVAAPEDEEAADRSPPVSEEDDLDAVARRSVEEGPLGDAGVVWLPDAPTRPEEPVLRGEPSNVVHLRAAPRPPPEGLTGTEVEAFRRIAHALAAQQDERERAERASTSERETPAAAPPTGASGQAIDRDVVDRVPIGLVIFRGEKVLFANRTLLDLVGYESLDELIAAGGVAAVFPDRAAGWAAERFDNSDAALHARRRHGDRLPVDARLNTVTWQGATALMLSISPRHAAEAPVAAEGEPATPPRVSELEEILDTATDGVIVVDASGRIDRLSRAAEALFGVDGATFRGRNITDLLAAESHKPALDYLDGLATNGVASVLNDGREVIGAVPSGGLIPLFMTMGRIGRSDKFCAVLRDITHWKNVEEELTNARQDAEAANAQKSEFLAKVSHEIRTPLNAIIGFSEVMMEERFGPIDNERYRSYLRDIHVSGAHLISLINDLLDLSKIEAGKLELSFESVAVNRLIQESVALMQPLANRERIIIRTSLSVDVPDVVADARSLRQILLNLLSNAIKFTKAGGQVIVSSVLEETGAVAVRVRDTGVGMSEKDIETALKPFRQVAAGKTRDKGTGLGLPLTKAMVEANRASLTIESAIDQGTLIKITFPTTRVLTG